MPKVKEWKPPAAPKLRKIEDVLVEGDVYVRVEDGSDVKVHIVVGRPTPVPGGKDSYCPIQAKGFFRGVMNVYGVGPVDTLANAMEVLKMYWRYIDGITDHVGILPKPQLRRWRGYRIRKPRTGARARRAKR